MSHFPTPQECADIQTAPLSRSKVNEGKERKKPLFSPLCAARLKPIRQKTKNAVVSEINISHLKVLVGVFCTMWTKHG